MNLSIKYDKIFFFVLETLMTQLILCKKLQKELPAMSKAPFPGDLGQQLLSEISEMAWQMWLGHQSMLINEYRLNLIDPQARSFLRQEMQKFFYEGGSQLPPGYQD